MDSKTVPKFIAISAAAKLSGLSIYLLDRGIRDASIPVEIRMVGACRKRYLNTEQLLAWLETEEPAQPRAAS